MLYLLGVLAVFVGIAVSIALHEIGHLVPAKAFGVRVTQYMIGFGPTVLSRRRGETEYGIKAIPLGGYIRMIGMYPPHRGEPAGTVREDSTGFFQQMAEEAKVKLRNARRDANERFKSLKKENTISEDEMFTQQEQVQKETDKAIEKVDAMLAAKEKDIMQI